MTRGNGTSGRLAVLLGPALCLGALIALGGPAQAFTPESPAVKAIVERAAKYLDTADDGRIGGRCLIAMALVKAGRPVSHPLVKAAIEDCRAVCKTPDAIGDRLDIYETSVAILFLCELSPSTYQQEISQLFRSLEARQKAFGGWGYPQGHAHAATGDTSMTQYAVLCSWVASRSGVVPAPIESTERVCNWLLRTQDPSGGWGYQGRDPGAGSGTRVAQQEVRHSLCAAGLGSVYICADVLGVISVGAGAGLTDPREEGLPAALKLVVPEVATDRARAPDRGRVEGRLVREAVTDGNRWFSQNYRINPPEWTLYYLYTLERYQSFRELAEGRVQSEPRWYNDGVRLLQSAQKSNGSWDMAGGGSVVDTAFGILFLKRSAQKAIERTAEGFEGLLTGGRGLPGDTTSIRVKEGQIVRTPFQGTVESLLAILDDTEHPDLETISEEANVAISSDPSTRSNQLRRLRRLVDAESYPVRIAAVRALGSVRDFDSVPALIYALSDPDARVVEAARRGLRFISRKFSGFGMPRDPSDDQRQQAIDAWKQWYLSIRPDAQFLN